MGMFDQKSFLTGENGVLNIGDRFTLHNARIADRLITVGGKQLPEAVLTIALESDPGRVFDASTSSAGITSQVERMDASDKDRFPLECWIVTKPTPRGETHLIMPYGQQPEANQAA